MSSAIFCVYDCDQGVYHGYSSYLVCYSLQLTFPIFSALTAPLPVKKDDVFIWYLWAVKYRCVPFCAVLCHFTHLYGTHSSLSLPLYCCRITDFSAVKSLASWFSFLLFIFLMHLAFSLYQSLFCHLHLSVLI